MWWPPTRKEELPGWLRVYHAVHGVIFGLIVIGFGIAYAVMGHTAGRIAGLIVILAGLLMIAVRTVRRRAPSD